MNNYLFDTSIVQELIGHYDSRYQAFLTDLLNNKEALSEAFNTYTTRKNRQKAPGERTPDDAVKNNQTVVPGSAQGDDKKSTSVPPAEEDDESRADAAAWPDRHAGIRHLLPVR